MKNSLIFIALLNLISIPHGLCQATSSSTQSTGTKSTFSFEIKSSYGVITSANANPNFKTENEAVLKLKSGSFVTNKFGNEAENVNVVWTATPTGGSVGGNVDINGITSKNLLLIDDGTYFRSSLKSVDNPDPAYGFSASSSALATHTSTINIERGESSFSQSFTNAF